MTKKTPVILCALLCICIVNAQNNKKTDSFAELDTIFCIQKTDELIASINADTDLCETAYSYEQKNPENGTQICYNITLKQNSAKKIAKATVKATDDLSHRVYTAWYAESGNMVLIREVHRKYNRESNDWENCFTQSFYFKNNQVIAAEYGNENPRLILAKERIDKKHLEQLIHTYTEAVKQRDKK